MGCMYQVCVHLPGGRIRVIASGLRIGAAASLRKYGARRFMRMVRYPFTA